LNEAVHQIAGSPWAKPASNPTTRPTDPLAIAKYASSLAFALTLGWVIYLLFSAIWDYTTIGKVIAEIILAILSFFGLFWNSYFTVSSIFKCFIPAKAFQTNTKYCSVVPEKKPKNEAWLDVTIQIPVYKESLQEVMMPTLKSCLVARNDYIRKSEGARCNIVICDDGMMAYLKNNFAAAEMLWETIEATKGKYFKLSQLLQKVPKPSRRHLKGLSSQSVYEVFHRMLFYYHYKIGFVARSTWDRRGKFKKASNLNSHLRLVWGAEQIAASENMSLAEALVENSHNSDGSRFTMFGGDVAIGHLILINDADARMSQSVIIKTVPEFLNDKGLGFTQHATKTLDDQRGESFYINMLSAYTDALYQGHFLLSSILGCHPPL
jgi:cellulose synthase/poly-beta-1,6-N-acetylglucosamine synthase-like glycosyltransferase